jgi:hypothetical protein
VAVVALVCRLLVGRRAASVVKLRRPSYAEAGTTQPLLADIFSITSTKRALFICYYIHVYRASVTSSVVSRTIFRDNLLLTISTVKPT